MTQIQVLENHHLLPPHLLTIILNIKVNYWSHTLERLLLNNTKMSGFLASEGEEFNQGPEMRLDRSELLCNKVLSKYKRDRESF